MLRVLREAEVKRNAGATSVGGNRQRGAQIVRLPGATDDAQAGDAKPA